MFKIANPHPGISTTLVLAVGIFKSVLIFTFAVAGSASTLTHLNGLVVPLVVSLNAVVSLLSKFT